MSKERNYLVTVGLVEYPSGRLVASALPGVTFEGTEALCEVAEAATLVQIGWRFPEDFIGGSAFTTDDGEEVEIDEDSARHYQVKVLAVERVPEERLEGKVIR